MPLDYSLSSSLVRVKLANSPGTFDDDPDVADPGVALSTTFLDADASLTLAWKMPGRTSSTVKLKVTFRKDDGAEVAGTFNVYGFGVVPLHAAEVAVGATRPSIEKVGTVAGTSATPLVLDDLGLYDVFGVRLSSIVAPLATRAFVRCEEVGDAS